MEAGPNQSDPSIPRLNHRRLPSREGGRKKASPRCPANSALLSRVFAYLPTGEAGDHRLQDLGCAIIGGAREEYLTLCRNGIILDGLVAPGLPPSVRCGGYRLRSEVADLINFIRDDGIQDVIDLFGLTKLNAEAIRERILRDGIQTQTKK